MRQKLAIAAVVLLVLAALAIVGASSTQIGDVHEESWTVQASGVAGAATGDQSSRMAIGGHIYAVHVDFLPSISSTTDITLSLASPALTVLTLTNTMTDAWYYPSVALDDSAGAARTSYEEQPFFGQMKAEAAQTTSATNVITLTVWWGP